MGSAALLIIMKLVIALSVVAALCGLALSGPIENRDDSKVVMCYYGSWAVYRPGRGKFDVENIDPLLCTHLMYGFAGLDPNKYTIKSLDPWNDYFDNWGKGAFDRFTNLKKLNPNLKTILAIGGWNEGATHYSEMVKTQERRSGFIDSAVEMLLKHNFDGLDMDWEYPGGRSDSAGSPEDKENFAKLLREMRAKFNEHGLMITAAVSAGYQVIEQAYDVPTMSETLDFINVMTYDYHGWWDNHHFTGHNSPLYGRPEEEDEESPGFQWNMDYSISLWLEKGAAPSKLLLGLATYGHGFALQNKDEHGIYAPARDGNPAGPYTRAKGTWGYQEICDKVVSPGDWTVVRNEYISAPYAYKDNIWIGFDDEESIRLKAQYALSRNLAGVMFWSIETDDFSGVCGPKPLILAAAEELNGGKMTTPDGWTTPDPDVSSTTPGQPTPPPNDKCDGTPGPKPDPEDCHDYYTCSVQNGEWIIQEHSCGELAFNPESGTCDWPYNVPACDDQSTTQKDGSTVTPGPGRRCTAGDPMLPVPGDCSSFYECDPRADGSGSEYVKKQCGDGLAFNPDLQICDWPSNVAGCD